MKLSKKILAAFSVAAMLVTAASFVGCKDEDDEDNSIKGNDITVDNTSKTVGDTVYTKIATKTVNGKNTVYVSSDGTNPVAETDDYVWGTKRAYSSTRLKHLGTLARLELREQAADSDDGAIGVIWDLKKHGATTVSDTDGEPDENGKVDAIDFFIVAFRNSKNKLGFYVSKFANVTNVNDENFGAVTGGSASETVIVDGDSTNYQRLVSDNKAFASLGDANIVDGTIYIWVDIYPANTKYGLHKADYASDDKTGEFIVDIYLGADKPTAASTPTKTVEITTAQTGYTTTIAQAKPARYGNAYPTKKMTGYVKYQSTYAEAEVVEE